jgi:hypothetical protein
MFKTNLDFCAISNKNSIYQSESVYRSHYDNSRSMLDQQWEDFRISLPRVFVPDEISNLREIDTVSRNILGDRGYDMPSHERTLMIISEKLSKSASVIHNYKNISEKINSFIAADEALDQSEQFAAQGFYRKAIESAQEAARGCKRLKEYCGRDAGA